MTKHRLKDKKFWIHCCKRVIRSKGVIGAKWRITMSVERDCWTTWLAEFCNEYDLWLQQRNFVVEPQLLRLSWFEFFCLLWLFDTMPSERHEGSISSIEPIIIFTFILFFSECFNLLFCLVLHVDIIILWADYFLRLGILRILFSEEAIISPQ